MCYETNGLNGATLPETRSATNDTPLFNEPGNVPLWASRNLKKWVRIRLLSDPGYPEYDLSYAYAELIDGSVVRATTEDLPGLDGRYGFDKPLRNWKNRAIEDGKKRSVFLKATGLFDAISTLC